MTNYQYKKMRKAYADKIKSWRYEGYMKEIYMDPYYENIDSKTRIMKGPANCDGYAVLLNKEIFGLVECYLQDDGIIELGLALNPKFVGKGLSTNFILRSIDFISREYQYKKTYVQLTVEVENKSAYYAYVKAGFVEETRRDKEILMKYYLT